MKIVASLFCIMLSLAGSAATAQSWPGKTVRLIISTGGGTSPDRIGRIVADRREYWKQLFDGLGIKSE